MTYAFLPQWDAKKRCSREGMGVLQLIAQCVSTFRVNLGQKALDRREMLQASSHVSLDRCFFLAGYNDLVKALNDSLGGLFPSTIYLSWEPQHTCLLESKSCPANIKAKDAYGKCICSKNLCWSLWWFSHVFTIPVGCTPVGCLQSFCRVQLKQNATTSWPFVRLVRGWCHKPESPPAPQIFGIADQKQGRVKIVKKYEEIEVFSYCNS